MEVKDFIDLKESKKEEKTKAQLTREVALKHSKQISSSMFKVFVRFFTCTWIDIFKKTWEIGSIMVALIIIFCWSAIASPEPSIFNGNVIAAKIFGGGFNVVVSTSIFTIIYFATACVKGSELPKKVLHGRNWKAIEKMKLDKKINKIKERDAE